ncbi:MAG: DUF5309 family protein [Planctomycetes bacterium]|nr:DUF5309 family protein [Planctomycetota bacterium]
MAFTGKATYDGGATLPELFRDVSDVIGMVTPWETPLLDAIGDAERPASSTKHEWLEDALNPHQDRLDGAINTVVTEVAVDDGAVFRPGDVVKLEVTSEVMMVTGVADDTLTVVRGYGGTTAASGADQAALLVIGHAALEGEDAAASAERARVVKSNFTQIFTETVKVSGTLDSLGIIGADREFDYQLVNRLRELTRNLERSVLCGVKSASTPEGSDTVRRTMQGMLPSVSAGVTDAGGDPLTEAVLNGALRAVWELGGAPNAIVCNGYQKRQISSFITTGAQYEKAGADTARALIGVYESDFGRQKVILSRWMPKDQALLLDLERVKVLPLVGRSFFARQLAAAGDYRLAQIVGEYTLEIHNAGDGGHGRLTNLATT